ncbi:hypothetical protein [Methylosarcina fibrata]|uniref:hypothetical protein n=1 Tax=Methylosarcina fibrata TaxID=105972 RepID=UPI0003607776|nr:hypothetical protein [Methylosarcina fibrata]
MKIKIINFAFTLAALCLNGPALAYEADIEEEMCKKPKYTDFTLTEYKEPERIEVAPESEFEFKISAWADPTTLKLTARREKVDYTVESTSTFHRIKAKLPSSLNGKFARIDASVKAVLGCDEQKGWLVKIADKTPESAAPAPTVNEEAPSPAPPAEARPNPPVAAPVAPETAPQSPPAEAPATQ